MRNAAEQAETRKNSTVAREFEVVMSAELDRGQRLALVREVARELVTRHGMAVDVAIHEPGKEGDHRNHHAHILCSTRRLTPAGFADKTRELDNQKSGEVGHWRAKWAEISNRHLERAGREQRASAIEQGELAQAAALERMQTVHIGPKVVKMERRGIRTDRGDQNRAAKHYNSQVVDLAEVRQRIAAAKANQVEPARQVEPLDPAPIAVSGRSEIAAAVMKAQDLHMRTPAANEPVHAVGPDPEKIKADWGKREGPAAHLDRQQGPAGARAGFRRTQTAQGQGGPLRRGAAGCSDRVVCRVQESGLRAGELGLAENARRADEAVGAAPQAAGIRGGVPAQARGRWAASEQERAAGRAEGRPSAPQAGEELPAGCGERKGRCGRADAGQARAASAGHGRAHRGTESAHRHHPRVGRDEEACRTGEG